MFGNIQYFVSIIILCTFFFFSLGIKVFHDLFEFWFTLTGMKNISLIIRGEGTNLITLNI